MDFVAASRFDGARQGYVFKRGDNGVGYYTDIRANSTTQHGRSTSSNLPAGFYDEEDPAPTRKHKRAREDFEKKTTEDLILEEAAAAVGAKPESEAIITLDAKSLRAMLVSLDKRIKANETMRLKYEDPSKFMETELDLHGAVQDVHALAASPELYPVLLRHESSLDNLVGLLGHANADIVVAVVELFVEMTDISDDAPEGDEQSMLSFISQWVNEQGALESLVPSLGCYDWKLEVGGGISATTEKGVTATLSLLENLLEAEKRVYAEGGTPPIVSSTLLSKTDALSALCSIFSKIQGFHPLKLHVSEVVSALLGHAERAAETCRAQALAIVEPLLQAQAAYRKKAPALGVEEEFFLNITLSLSSLCRLHFDCGWRIHEAEGVQLQMLILKQHAGDVNVQGALQVLSYLTSDNASIALKAVEEGALKYVFPYLMGGRALLSKGKSGPGGSGGISSAAERALIQGHAVSVVANLIIHLHDSSSLDASTRLALKIAENNAEKLRKVCDLFVRYYANVASVEREMRDSARSLQSQVEQLSEAVEREKGRGGAGKATMFALREAEAELVVIEDEEILYGKRLQGGLHELQQLAVIIAFGLLYDPSSAGGDRHSGGHVRVCTDSLKGRSARKDLSNEVGLLAVVGVLREQAAFLVREAEVRKEDVGEPTKRKQAVLIEWVAQLAHKVEKAKT